MSKFEFMESLPKDKRRSSLKVRDGHLVDLKGNTVVPEIGNREHIIAIERANAIEWGDLKDLK